jgi:hypothetical protein
VGVQRRSGHRSILVMLRVNRPTTARLALKQGGKQAASGRFRVKPGTNKLSLGVANRVAGGSYRLTVTLVNPDGGLLSLPARGVRLPSAR